MILVAHNERVLEAKRGMFRGWVDLSKNRLVPLPEIPPKQRRNRLSGTSETERVKDSDSVRSIVAGNLHQLKLTLK
jgi:hypothetical protein